MGYSPVILIALLGWPFLMAALVVVIPVRRVVLISIIGGNLFLPQAGLVFSGFPNYTKPLAAGLGALVAALLVATPQLLSWRPKVLDVFFFSFLLAPAISSLMNGLGGYDALSAGVNRFLEWGVAYWVGRSLFTDSEGMRELALGFVLGGLVYVPFCVWESVMSPQLHKQIYGFRPSDFGMTKRWGGWRPNVFMQHGLAVGAWMASAALVAWVLWRAKVVRSVCGIPIMIVALGLVVVTIGLRSTGAAALMIVLIAAAEIVHMTRLRVVLLALLLGPAGYIGLRVAGWDGQQLMDWSATFAEDRVGSLRVRLENDALIVDRAMEQPVFGWGRWGRWRVKDEVTGEDITISDSWWGILVGSTGVFGLVAAYGTFIAPMFQIVRRKLSQRIFAGADGAAWGVGLAVMLFVLDTLFNAMPNSSYMLAAGALGSFALHRGRIASTRPVSVNSVDTKASVKPRVSRIDLR